ncbi:ArsC/Spx/MgsR family protein [Lactococcus sp. DD01]|uniref:ArsC/Spx/MgsR family protein n=1 Tax=Lactococcus sp. DD01 TaxID=1776443 RepID=UPI0007936DBD|nr:negative regulator of proteolysis [Lactococcus sp. DD01]
MNFDAGIDFLLDNPELLQSPIVIDSNKYMIGFNSDDIRQFLPKKFRKISSSNL